MTLSKISPLNFLVLLFPVSIMGIKGLGDLILFTLMCIGVYIAVKDKVNVFKHPKLKLFSFITIIYFSIVLISIAFSGKFFELLHFSSRELHFLFAPLIVLSLYKADFSPQVFLLSIKVALLVLGSLALYQYFNGARRPSWVMNSDVYGNLMVMLFFLSIVNINNERAINLLATIASSAIGLTAILLSGTRGAWLSFILLSIIWIILQLNKNKKDVIRPILFLVLTLIAITLWATFDNTLKKRASLAITNLQSWYSGENKHTSVGQRLTMYQTGLLAAKEKPFIGHGYRNTNQAAAKFTEGRSATRITRYNHLHNAYITNFVFGGIFALLALLILLFLPLKAFWSHFLRTKNTIYSEMGILLTVGYASFGLVNILFGDVFMNAFYVFFLGILLPRSYSSL